MNYKRIRDKIIGNNSEKLNLLKTNYLDGLVKIFNSNVTDEDLMINLQIISTLTCTKSSNARTRIRRDIPVYFNAMKKYIGRVVQTFNGNNDCTIASFECFLDSIADKECFNTWTESNDDDPGYMTCEWRDRKHVNYGDGTRDKIESRYESNDLLNGDNRFVIVDIERDNHNSENVVRYIYDDTSNRFILSPDLNQNVIGNRNLPIDSQGHANDHVQLYNSPINLFPETSVINEPYQDVLTTREGNIENSNIARNDPVNDRIDDVLPHGILNNNAQNNTSDVVSNLDMNRIQEREYNTNRDDELVRLINYIIRRRSRDDNIENDYSHVDNIIEDGDNIVRSNSFEYNEVHVPVMNDILGGNRLTPDDIERISERFNDYRSGHDFLSALNSDLTDVGAIQPRDDSELQSLRAINAAHDASIIDRINEAFGIDENSRSVVVQTMPTPVPIGGLNYLADDLSFSDSHNFNVTEDGCQESEISDQIIINTKVRPVYNYLTHEKQDAVVSVIRSFFQTVIKSSYYNDDILLFALWFLKNENSLFLEEYYRDNCIKEACYLLNNLSIRKRTACLIDTLSYLNDYKIDEYNLKAYKYLITKNNFIQTNINNIERLIRHNFNENNIEYIECYIRYVNHVKEKNKESHYIKIIDNIRTNIHQNPNEYMLLISKLSLYNEEAQNVCSKKYIVEIVIEIFKQQIILNHNTKFSLLCMYSLCDIWESNRKILVRHKIIPTIFDIFKIKLKDKIFDKEFLAIICLIKSMTRCVQFLRNDLLEFPIVELFLLVIKYVSKTRNSKNIDILPIFSCSDCNEKELCSFAILKESFCILSNLVMDHGNYKIKFINRNGLKVICKIGRKTNLEYWMFFLFKNFLYESTLLEKQHFMEVCTNKKCNKMILNNFSQDSNRNEHLQDLFLESNLETIDTTLDYYIQNVIQNIESTLECNLFYIKTNDKNIFTRTFLKYKRLNLNITNNRIRTKLTTMKEFFNTIRNMVCATNYETYRFFMNYPYLLENVILFFIKLLRSTKFNTQKRSVIIEILYIFSNICANTDAYKSIFIQPFITCEIKKLFMITNRDVVLALVWFITNMSWIEDENGYERNKLMIEYGYREYLIKVKNLDPYISDKVTHAIDNLNA